MRIWAALLTLCAPVWGANTLSSPAPRPGAAPALPSVQAGLPEIPALPVSLVQIHQAPALGAAILPAGQFGAAAQAPALPAALGANALPLAALGANAIPSGPQHGSLPLAAAAPAEGIAAQAAQEGGRPAEAMAAGYDGFVKRGFELEYTVGSAPQTSAELLPAETYGAAVRLAGRRFGLSAPSYAPDEKHGQGHQTAFAADGNGRAWKAVPEEVDGVKYDGVELITPPLTSPGEVEKLALVHEDALAGALFVRGISSSMHVTYDVSHLVTEDGDAARLVDAILFVESNWEKIYAAAAPTRYGTVVNRFSIPLAVDHPGLLQELAALPRAQRSFDNVRAVFARYEAAELKRWGHTGKTWKMRAANYGKLFGLQTGYENAALRVIEFRIADLPEDPARIPKLSELFAALVTRAPPTASFTPPFPAGGTFRDFNARIAGQSRIEYASFLRGLGLPEADYPLMGRLSLPESPSLIEAARAALAAAAKSALGLDFSGDPRPTERWLLELAQSTNAREKRFAIAALQGQEESVILTFAQVVLMSDADASVREAAIEHLTERFSDAVWPAFQAAAQDASDNVRYFVIAALHEQRDDPRAAPLLGLMLADPDQIVRTWAWSALGWHRTRETADILRQLLVHEDAAVRDAAHKQLDRRSDPAGLELRTDLLVASIEQERESFLNILKAREQFLRAEYAAKPWWHRAFLRLIGLAPRTDA